MIEGLFTLLAIPSTFVAPISGWMAWSYFRHGEREYALKAGAVFAVTAIILLIAYKGASGPNYTSDNCFIDWDGRANATVCD